MKEAWDRFWFTPGTARSARAVRIILAVQALWILLSRPQIPSLTSWPAAFFPTSHRLEYLRFGIVPGVATLESGLYLLLHIALVALIIGVFPRAMAAVAGLLLYHFAPFEEIIAGMPHTHFGGLTVPAVGLLIVAFAQRPTGDGDQRSSEYRWPVALIQLVFTFSYLFAFLAKLRFGGPGWFTAENMRTYALVNWAYAQPPLALAVARNPAVCWLVAFGTLVFEASAPLAVFWNRFRRAWLVAALAFHVGIVLTLKIFFPSMLLLLLLVDWDAVSEWVRPGRRTGRESLDASAQQSA